MELNSNEARIPKALEFTLAYSAQCGLLPYGIFARCGAVSRGWRGAVDTALRMFVHLHFRGHEARVTGGVVRCALERIGPSLRSVGLANCWGISGAEAEEILDRLAATCPKVEQMDLTGCTLEVVIRTFAVRTRHALSAASPLELYARINALQEEEGGDRMQFEDLRSRLMELPGPHIVLEGGQQDMMEAGALKRILLKEARQGSALAVALVLSLKFDDIQCTHDTVDNNSGSKLIHLAANRGDEAMVHLLLRTGAGVDEMDKHRSTALLMACKIGTLELAKMLVDAGAEVSAANDQGDTPLLAALMAGNLELAEVLVRKGADVTACRSDGAGMLALAIVSGKEGWISFAVKHGANRLQGYDDTAAGSAYVQQLAQAFLDPIKVGDWLRGGEPKMLIGEMGALMSHAGVTTAVKEQLSNVRAFLNRHIDLLQDPSRWPVPHFVEQLAAQEPDSTFARAGCALKANSRMMGKIIEWVKRPRVQHPLRLTLNSGGGVEALAFSPEGARLAQTVGCNVVVRDSTTGFTLSTLTGHRYVPSLSREYFLSYFQY